MILHNRFFLYFIFLIALFDFLYLGYTNDFDTLSIFILVGLLTAFFSKNMIIILSTAVIVANVLKWSGYNDSFMKEGLTNKDDEEEDEKEEDDVADDAVEEEEDSPKRKKKIKEDFGQDENVVYTSVEDQQITDQDKMILAHENLLKKMNKYKPLLDTLSGLTKNIAAVKQMSQPDPPVSDANTEEYEKETADIKTRKRSAKKTAK
jgi:hypothetical protein